MAKRSKAKDAEWARRVAERCTDDMSAYPTCEVHEAIRAIYYPERAESTAMAVDAHHMVHKSQWPAGAQVVRNGCGCCRECHDILHDATVPMREVIYAAAGRDTDYQEMLNLSLEATK